MSEAVPTTPGSPSPEQRIIQAQTSWDQVAIDRKVKAVTFRVAVALVAPLAVLLLAVQIMIFPHRCAAALGLIGVELALLFFALLVGFASLGPSPRRRVLPRLRSEILRRERFLLLARVGPYLTCSGPAVLDEAVTLRLDALDTAANRPAEFLPLRDRTGWWRDQLEDASPEHGAPPEEGCCHVYQNERIIDQREWYHQKAEFFAGREALWEGWAKGLLACALVLAAMHLIALAAGPALAAWGSERPLLQLIIEVAAISLPALGSAASAVQVLMQARHISRGYQEQARILNDLDDDLRALVLRERQAGPDTDLARLRLELKRVVLRNEELLSNELRHWYPLMAPEA